MSVQSTTNAQNATPINLPRGVENRPVRSAETQSPKQPQASRSEVESAAKKTQEFVQSLNSSSLQFAVDDSTGVTVVKVVDLSTKETIRQIPSQEMLDIAKALDRLNGILFKGKA